MKDIDKFSDEELKEELKRREQARINERLKVYAACQHEWQYWSDYYSKGRDCKKCGKQE